MRDNAVSHKPHPTEDASRTSDQPANSVGLKALALKALGRATPRGASWSGRNSFRVSSAFVPAPGVAEQAQRQGAPDPEEAAAEGSRNPEAASPVAEPAADREAHAPCPTCGCLSEASEEAPSWREEDDPPLLTQMYRKRTTAPRDQIKSVRFTPTAVHAITKAAKAYDKTFAGFVGDAAYAVALGRTSVSSPEDDPIRPLVERLDKLTAQLRRVGNNLNQITTAINSGALPAHAEAVLARVEATVEHIFRLLDQLIAEK